MAENKVILEFVGDATGLKPVIDTLSTLGNVTEEQVNQFKQANQEFNKAQKTADNTSKSVGKLAESYKQVQGAIAGKAIVEPLTQMAKATGDATTKAVSLKTELRALKAELAKLDEGSVEFEKLAQRAAKLEDQIGDVNERVRVLASDTFRFDAAVDAIRGVTAAFSVAQGAAALFGEENEDVQKALLKVQAATALLTGVQELANLATGQGAAKLAILSAAQKVQTFVTTAATGAVNLFRVALLSLGVGAVIAVLGAIVTYWEDISKFIGLSNEGIKEQKELEKQLAEEQKKRTEEIKDFNKEYEGTIGQAKLNLLLLEKQGATEKEILNAKKFLNIAEQETIKNKLRSGIISDEERTRQETLLKIKQAELKALDSQINKVKQVKKELQETIQLPLITESDDINQYAKTLAERIAKALQSTDLSKKLGEILGKVEVPPIKIDIDLKRSIEKQRFIEEELPKVITQALQTTFDTAFQLLDNATRQRFDEENRLLEEQRDKELANKDLTEAQKASIERRFQQQQAQLRKRQFNAEKQAALAQATINGALAISNILATVPGGPLNPATIASIALATLSTAAQIAIISSQKPPQFAKGGWIDGRPHSQGGTIIEAEKDEFIVNKRSARKYSPLLTALNEDKIPVAKALSLLDFKPNVADNDMLILENKNAIDYSKLGRAVAREMSKIPQSELQVNYRGLLTSINSQQSLIEWQKRKYN